MSLPESPSADERCILFADIAGSTRLYEKLGDTEAKHTIERCLKRVKMAVEAFHGRVVKTLGDAVMVEFNDVEACVQSACQMQQRVADLPPAGGQMLAIRVGFHCGPVLMENGDVFGDAVNLAARMTDVARGGQIIASRSSIDSLPPLMRQAMRELPAVSVKGKAEPVRVCEVLWQDEGDLTVMLPQPTTAKPVSAELHLRHDGKELDLAPAWEVLILGRDKLVDVMIDDPMASRQHARIERRGDKIMLIDQSTNGTWLVFSGEKEQQLRREEAVLLRTGRLSFGHPWREGDESVEFVIS